MHNGNNRYSFSIGNNRVDEIKLRFLFYLKKNFQQYNLEAVHTVKRILLIIIVLRLAGLCCILLRIETLYSIASVSFGTIV